MYSLKKNDMRQTKDAEMCDDTLHIECRKCKRAPNIRSSECMGCMVDCITECGNADRIRLRTSRDLELSGQAAELLCELAGIRMFAKSVHRGLKGRNCAGCEHSCERVLASAWSGFPEPSFDTARNGLMKFSPSSPACSNCIQKSYRILDQTELNMGNFRKKVSLEVARKGGR